jgi:hypothetical protein
MGTPPAVLVIVRTRDFLLRRLSATRRSHNTSRHDVLESWTCTTGDDDAQSFHVTLKCWQSMVEWAGGIEDNIHIGGGNGFFNAMEKDKFFLSGRLFLGLNRLNSLESNTISNDKQWIVPFQSYSRL